MEGTKVEIINLKQAAKFLNISESTLRRHIKAPKPKTIPHFQLGENKNIYFDKRKITDWWLDNHKPIKNK